MFDQEKFEVKKKKIIYSVVEIGEEINLTDQKSYALWVSLVLFTSFLSGTKCNVCSHISCCDGIAVRVCVDRDRAHKFLSCLCMI